MDVGERWRNTFFNSGTPYDSEQWHEILSDLALKFLRDFSTDLLEIEREAEGEAQREERFGRSVKVTEKKRRSLSVWVFGWWVGWLVGTEEEVHGEGQARNVRRKKDRKKESRQGRKEGSSKARRRYQLKERKGLFRRDSCGLRNGWCWFFARIIRVSMEKEPFSR